MNFKNNNPTIVISTFNRINSFSRLLNSIKNADYSGYDNIRLVISIDGGGLDNNKIEKIANEFDWGFGEKIVINHSKNLGLRNHIIYCGDLSQKYGDIILLEDDLIVSPNFYIFSKKSLDFYRNKEKISGISLYSYRYNENADLPFIPIKDNSDIYFMQVPSSWGQAWTKEWWGKFKEYYNKKPIIDIFDKLPENIKRWPETSWKKYFYKYIVDSDYYFVYPFVSMSSNLGNKGVHYLEETNILNVSLSYENRQDFVFGDIFSSNSIYDAYFEISPVCINKYTNNNFNHDVLIDLYGTKQMNIFNNELWLTIKDSNKKIEKYAGLVFPIEENIIRNMVGDIFCLSKKEHINDSIDFKENFLRDVMPLLNNRINHVVNTNNNNLNLIKTELNYKDNELCLIKTELNSRNEELNLTKIKFESIGSELSSLYSSRTWRIVVFFRKIFNILIPKGGLLRKGCRFLFNLIKKIRNIFYFFISIKNYFIRFKPRKKRKINFKSRKIVFVDHYFHKQTKSSLFVVDYLKVFFDVEIIWDESYKGSEYPDLSFINDEYLAVIFWQSIPGLDILSNIKNDNIIFFPMYDGVRHDYGFWNEVRGLKIINFSNTLHKKIKKWGLDSMYIQYFPEPKDFIPGEKNKVFFWQRLTHFNINTLVKLFKKENVSLHIHKAIDPGHNFIKPSKEVEEKFEITYSDWFDTKEEMWNTIKQKGIYIAPRESEGIGMSFLEAMAMGKAVVAINNPTMNEYIIDGYNGYLFDLKNPKEIDFSNIEQVQKNTYKYIQDGYKKWEEEKIKIIDFIKFN